MPLGSFVAGLQARVVPVGEAVGRSSWYRKGNCTEYKAIAGEFVKSKDKKIVLSIGTELYLHSVIRIALHLKVHSEFP